LSKDVLLVLGASSDIGSKIIQSVYGEDTIILAHYNKSLEKVASLKKSLGENIVPIQADLSKEEAIFSMISFIEKNYSFPTKIVHLPAPKVKHVRFKDITWKDFELFFSLQLKSIVLILNRFLPLMAKNKCGKVVFILSSYTYNVPPKALSHYVTAKYGLLGLMKALASEYAEKGIQINAVSPSMVETTFLSEISKRLVEIESDLHPLKRNALPNDIAPMVKLLLSNESNFITGTNLPISGGGVF
jgi:3-oxoacyl-[acyl-carrier protein] reductase